MIYEVSPIYADMLEFRQQMDEGVPFAHLYYRKNYSLLLNMYTIERKLAIGSW